MSRNSAKKYWRNLAARDGKYQSIEQSDADGPFSMDRRRFMALLGATAALSTAGCGADRDRGEILPYVDQPEGAPAGTPVLYASTLTRYPAAPPVLVTTREGRPVKLEGNPRHPASLGGLDAWGQSATLTLYDPDRLRAPLGSAGVLAWGQVDERMRASLRQAADADAQILLFTPALNSPTARALVADFIAAYPTARHLPLETFHREEAIAGRRQVLGEKASMRADWSRADVVVSLEADFLGPTGSPADRRNFALRRRPEEGAMNRLWSVEAGLSLTGANADHRLPLRPTRQDRLVLGLLQATVAAGIASELSPLSDDLAPFALDRQAEELGLDQRTLKALSDDLIAHPGRSLVLAGNQLPAHLHALVAALNAALGNLGTTLVPDGAASPRVSTPEELQLAVAAMRAGQVAVIVDLEANPVYTLPPDLDFAGALKSVPTVASACLIPDETSLAAHLQLPTAHDLESWGDADVHSGVLSLQQPTIAPLFAARQPEEILLNWLPSAVDSPQTYHAYLKQRWLAEVYPRLASSSPPERFWTAALHEGFVPLPSQGDLPAPRIEGIRRAIVAAQAISPSGVDLVLTPSYHIYDGRFANNGWLQEMPHPVTSHVWGDGAFIGTGTAGRLQCEDGDLLEVVVEGRRVTLPAILLPGLVDDVVQIALGHGRSHAGKVGSGVGVDARPLGTSQGDISPWIYTGAALASTGAQGSVVRTQENRDIHGRHIVVEGSLAEYERQPDFAGRIAGRDTSPSPGAWNYAEGPKWGMVIDLTACTGCNACQVACTAENNVPVVGPEQVSRGREMHWIRVDRYFSGDPERPESVELLHQPMLCQHCDNAPCENVCPVAATTHSNDGLNEMTYNRCVGTRYCANNCPFKVRRFNYLANHEDLESPRELVFNPEVTVRSRGVMEKCTFCVQRLRAGQRTARRQGRPLRDDDVKTACEQACPADAIAFGDLNDPDSRVARLAAGTRGYNVLSELGVRPSITYLARIRNPHPDLRA